MPLKKSKFEEQLGNAIKNLEEQLVNTIKNGDTKGLKKLITELKESCLSRIENPETRKGIITELQKDLTVIIKDQKLLYNSSKTSQYDSKDTKISSIEQMEIMVENLTNANIANLTIMDSGIDELEIQQKLNYDLVVAVEKENLDEVHRLIEKGASIRATNGQGKSTLEFAKDSNNPHIVNLFKEKEEEYNKGLIAAVKKPDLQEIEKLLSMGANSNIKDEETGKTLLHLAIDNDHFALISVLIRYTDSFSTTNNNIEILLKIAKNKHNEKIVELLEEQLEIDNQLTEAIKNKSFDIQKILELIIKGARMNTPECQPNIFKLNSENSNSLFSNFASYAQDDLIISSLKKFLLEKFPLEKDTIIKYKDIYELLNFAAIKDCSDIVSLLLKEAELDVNKLTPDGRTALHFAIDNNSLKAAKTLIDHGAELDIKDSDGHSPLYISILHKNINAVQLLARHGAKLDINDDDNLLTVAILSYHISYNTTDVNTNSITKWSVNFGNEYEECDFPIIPFLLKKEVSANEQDKSGKTPLHLAIDLINIKVVEILAKETDLSLKDIDNRTPIELAITLLERITLNKDFYHLMLQQNLENSNYVILHLHNIQEVCHALDIILLKFLSDKPELPVNLNNIEEFLKDPFPPNLFNLKNIKEFLRTQLKFRFRYRISLNNIKNTIEFSDSKPVKNIQKACNSLDILSNSCQGIVKILESEEKSREQKSTDSNTTFLEPTTGFKYQTNKKRYTLSTSETGRKIYIPFTSQLDKKTSTVKLQADKKTDNSKNIELKLLTEKKNEFKPNKKIDTTFTPKADKKKHTVCSNNNTNCPLPWSNNIIKLVTSIFVSLILGTSAIPLANSKNSMTIGTKVGIFIGAIILSIGIVLATKHILNKRERNIQKHNQPSNNYPESKINEANVNEHSNTVASTI